ncbi:MAG TPA: c-type cytochrome [Pyrinomonadaceae bacterium]|nr:c-type cytochrome [Pyrinomonadaceae bacterium]
MPHRSWKKFGAITILVIITMVIVAITFTIGWRPLLGAKKRALTDRKFAVTPQRLARGRYLVDGVLGCFGCHTDQDWSKPGAPPVAGKEGSGHVWSDQDLPWLIAPNITPDKETGAGNWSDDTLARAIREGIGHDGRALFPIMPYSHYRQLSDEDLASVIVYLRTAPAVRNQLATTKMPFPLNFLMQNMPQPVDAAVPPPDQSTPVTRGNYLVRMGACEDCHTPQEKGQPMPGMDFAGGFLMHEPQRDVVSANITPAASGIGYYNDASFVQAMRIGKVGARPLHASMPWYFYGKMTEDDLKSVFAFLQTVKPVKHQVDNTEPPTYCRLCKQKHGFGRTN